MKRLILEVSPGLYYRATNHSGSLLIERSENGKNWKPFSQEATPIAALSLLTELLS